MRKMSWRARACACLVAGMLQACGGGGGGDGPAPSAPPAGVPGTVTQTTGASVPVTVAADQAVTVQVAGSTAQVSLPAQAFVAYDNPSQPIQGMVEVSITPIAPSVSPLAMAGGNYTARVSGSSTATQRIESFGAITVELSQGERRLQLAPGKTATIRIPLDTRSTERPATIPLYFWNEVEQVWVQEGSATLRGNASSGYYYEGEVSHFSTWNADRPINESVTIRGCVQTAQGAPVNTSNYLLYSDGLDYSGMALGSDGSATGSFTVQMKKGGRARLLLMRGTQVLQTAELGTVSADLTLKTCLVLPDTAPEPTPVPVPELPTIPGTVQAFLDLIGQLNDGMGLALDAIAVGDADTQTLRSPEQACASGTVRELTLNGVPARGGETLPDDTDLRVHARYDACVPMPAFNQQVSDDDARLSGGVDALLRTGLNATGERTTTITSTLSALNNATTAKTGQGTFELSIWQSALTAPQEDQVVTWTPRAGSTLTHTFTGRTVGFVSGSVRSTWTDLGSPAGAGFGSELAYRSLTYTLGGATYVLDGSLVNNVGRLTLTKNGQLQATLVIGSAGISATGTVDPF